MDHIKIGNAQGKGQGVFARHKLLPKDTLYTIDEPVIAAISPTELPNFCYHCYAGSQPPSDQWYSMGQYRDAKLKLCAGCNVAYFCGKECQRAAWKKYHKHECKTFKALCPRVLPEFVRAVMRFALQHDNGLLPDGMWSTVLAATSHIDKLKQSGWTWTNFMLTAKAAHEYSKTKVGIDTILKLLCVLKVNAISLTTTYGDPIGLLLDPMILKLNHSCEPNIALHRPLYTNATGWLQQREPGQAMAILVPLREIVEGEELTIPYIDFQDNVEKRQAELKKNYFFTCTCTKCKRDELANATLRTADPDRADSIRTWTKQADEILKKLQELSFTPDLISGAIKSLTEIVTHVERDPAISFGTDPYPKAIHELKLLHMDNRQGCDHALICALKQHLLIGPQVYASPLYPTRITNAIYLLQILALLDDTFSGPSSHSPQIMQQRREIEKRGLSREGFTYWRLRITVDTRQPLAFQKSAAQDLLKPLDMEQVTVGIDDRMRFAELASSERIKKKCEEEMRKVLGLAEGRWEEAMRSWKT